MLRHALNGTFAVYKPRGYTSRKVTDIVQRSLSEQLLARQGIQKKIKQRDMVKIGHGGTLVRTATSRRLSCHTLLMKRGRVVCCRIPLRKVYSVRLGIYRIKKR